VTDLTPTLLALGYLEPRASKKSQEILILDQRRAYQVNIMLGGMKHTYPQIRQALLRMDEEFMTLVQLSNLLKFVPDAEEVKTKKTSKHNQCACTWLSGHFRTH